MTNQKLKALHTELKVHDKEAMALKKLLADGMDKEGLREAELRKKFNGIMHSYGMVKPSIKFEDDKKQLKKVSFTLIFYLKVVGAQSWEHMTSEVLKYANNNSRPHKE